MATDFETPTIALFERLSSLSTKTGGAFQYVTRILENWDSVAPAKQPALMLTSGDITEFAPKADLVGLAPILWKMQNTATIYVQTPNPNTPPSTILNPLIAAVCEALRKQSGEVMAAAAGFPANLPGQSSTTLGGLCAYCRVVGKIVRAEGLKGNVAAASIPIEMVLKS